MVRVVIVRVGKVVMVRVVADGGRGRWLWSIYDKFLLSFLVFFLNFCYARLFLSFLFLCIFGMTFFLAMMKTLMIPFFFYTFSFVIIRFFLSLCSLSFHRIQLFYIFIITVIFLHRLQYEFPTELPLFFGTYATPPLLNAVLMLTFSFII